MKCGERLKKLRQEKKITTNELGEIFKSKGFPKLNGQAIRKIESNLRDLSIDEYEAYRQVFDVPVDYLMGFSKVRKLDKDTQMIGDTLNLNDISITNLINLSNNPKINTFLDFILSNTQAIYMLDEIADFVLDYKNAFVVPVVENIDTDSKKPNYTSGNVIEMFFKKHQSENKPLKERRYPIHLSDVPNEKPKDTVYIDSSFIDSYRERKLIDACKELQKLYKEKEGEINAKNKNNTKSKRIRKRL